MEYQNNVNCPVCTNLSVLGKIYCRPLLFMVLRILILRNLTFATYNNYNNFDDYNYVYQLNNTDANKIFCITYNDVYCADENDASFAEMDVGFMQRIVV